jgi:hypothetical protein
MVPIIPLLAWLLIGGGGATLLWYDGLSKEEQDAAEGVACDYARQLYGKSLKELTKAQASHVALLTKEHFAN